MIDQSLILEAPKNKFALEIRGAYICQAAWGPVHLLSPRSNQGKGAWETHPICSQTGWGVEMKCPQARLELG